MGVCQKPTKPIKNNPNFKPPIMRRTTTQQLHTSTYYEGQLKRRSEIEQNIMFNKLLKEKEKKLEKKRTLLENKKNDNENIQNEKNENKNIENEKKEEEKKEEEIIENEKKNKDKNLLEKRKSSFRKRRMCSMQATLKLNETSIFNFNNIDDENDKNSNIHNFERGKRKSLTLIEKMKFGDTSLKDEVSLKLSNKTLIDETEGISLKKYKVISKIGNGSYGTVFLVNNIQLNTMAALKKIDRRIYFLYDSVQTEIDIIKLLEHPNIIRIHECIISPKFLYIINDYCPCGELYSNKKKPLNENQLSFIFFQIFSALIYLHNNNIIHRNIKIENILISDIEIESISKIKYFYIKMIDFAEAKFFDETKLNNEDIKNYLYVAPEVLKRKYNEKCDIWSVGVLLHLLIVGTFPFEGGSPTETLNKIRKGKFNTNNEKFLQSSEEVQDLIKQLLEVKVDKRLTAKEAIKHPWFSKFDAHLIYNNLEEEIIIKFINRLITYKTKNKFQQIVIAFIVHNINEDNEIRNIQKLFRIFNTNNDGWLTKSELYIGLCKYKDEKEISKNIDEIFKIIDKGNQGYIQYEEFLSACLQKDKILSEKNLLYAFNFIDKDSIGKLTIDSIKSSFGLNEDEVSDSVFNDIFKELSLENNNEMNFEEFKNMMFDME